MDTAIVELLGRNRLTDELVKAGLEVAIPVRDRGIDLIAFADLDTGSQGFVACPIQMKAASSRSFNIFKKYKKFPGLLIAYVWHVRDTEKTVSYALSYEEAVRVAEQMGYTKTSSWVDRGGYGTTRPGTRLLSLLAPYQMTPEKWRQRVLGHAAT